MELDEMKLLEEREVRLAKNNEIEAKFRAEIKQKTSLKLVNCVATATDGNQGGQGSSTDLVRFLQENEIDSVKELQEKLTELSKLKREINIFRNLQQKRERIAAASSSESNEEPKPDSSIVKSLRSKVKDLEQDKERLEEENQSLKAISSGKKMLGRIEGGNLSQSKENEEFQRQDGGRTRRKFSGSKKSIEARMPGEYYLEKEKARENVHNETMNGILPEYGGEEQKFFAKPHYQSSWNMGRSSEMAMFAMMQQMRTEDRLPERTSNSAKNQKKQEARKVFEEKEKMESKLKFKDAQIQGLFATSTLHRRMKEDPETSKPREGGS
ncbi:hypothetical protein L3Y34_011431 [Caenorhabditis briggsae]|uniref:Uncharacterized protein n=1 Tax=Caenorhabditis briggsae TaxID=6238 RepID=A0AAE8ZUA0_CAEBR|nr:hypothetical protein L3Y34_011431 [Caenorhabditis briggsae]